MITALEKITTLEKELLCHVIRAGKGNLESWVITFAENFSLRKGEDVHKWRTSLLGEAVKLENRRRELVASLGREVNECSVRVSAESLLDVMSSNSSWAPAYFSGLKGIKIDKQAALDFLTSWKE